MPLSGGDINLLEQILDVNTLPKVGYNLIAFLKLGAQREKKDQKEADHDIDQLLELVQSKESDYPEVIERLVSFVATLDNKKIITPVKRTSEFLEQELLVTHPQMLGMVAEQHKRTEKEQKKMSNVPEAGKIQWFKIMLVVCLALAVIVIGYIVFSSGMIQGISLPGQTQQNGGGGLTQAQLMAKYPDAEHLKAGIQKGEVQYNQLPPQMKQMVDKAK